MRLGELRTGNTSNQLQAAYGCSIKKWVGSFSFRKTGNPHSNVSNIPRTTVLLGDIPLFPNKKLLPIFNEISLIEWVGGEGGRTGGLQGVHPQFLATPSFYYWQT